MSEPLLTTGAVARALGVSINTVIRWCNAGDLTFVRLSVSGARSLGFRRIYRDVAMAFAAARGFRWQEETLPAAEVVDE